MKEGELIRRFNELALAAHLSEGLRTKEYRELMADPEKWAQLLDGRLTEEFGQGVSLGACRERLDGWRAQGIEVVGFGSSLYPGQLAEIHNPPLLLFCYGDRGLLAEQERMVAIVGSRTADSQGCAIARQFAEDLAGRGACIVSGLALGVDGAAHQGAIASGRKGATIAVLGSGLLQIYPAIHRGLAREIVRAGGLVMSHFEPNMKPFPSNFLDRNRIISGLSLGAVVIQAGQKSGALSTARHALEQGREVLVIPGPITHAGYIGSHRLIRQGAALVTSSEEIVSELPQLKITCGIEDHAESDRGLSPEQHSILELIGSETRIHYDAVVVKAVKVSDPHTTITDLELLGLIVREPGNYLALVRT